MKMIEYVSGDRIYRSTATATSEEVIRCEHIYTPHKDETHSTGTDSQRGRVIM